LAVSENRRRRRKERLHIGSDLAALVAGQALQLLAQLVDAAEELVDVRATQIKLVLVLKSFY
jgi:hypothetical protein